MVFPGATLCRVMASFHIFMFFISFSIYCIFSFFLLSKNVGGPWPLSYPVNTARQFMFVTCKIMAVMTGTSSHHYNLNIFQVQHRHRKKPSFYVWSKILIGSSFNHIHNERFWVAMTGCYSHCYKLNVYQLKCCETTGNYS